MLCGMAKVVVAGNCSSCTHCLCSTLSRWLQIFLCKSLFLPCCTQSQSIWINLCFMHVNNKLHAVCSLVSFAATQARVTQCSLVPRGCFLSQNRANQTAAFIFLWILTPEMPSNHFDPFIWPDGGVFGRFLLFLAWKFGIQAFNSHQKLAIA